MPTKSPKLNLKIDLAVLIAQAVQDSKWTNPKLAHAYTIVLVQALCATNRKISTAHETK